MTTAMTARSFADPAPAQLLERVATALTAHGFTVEILDDAADARSRIRDLIPNRLLILNAEHRPGRGTVLLLREAIGF